ncbi:unnamed protein product [marine sediment metagenome]|uniref:Uncharacterized protein n=1 Tax=marine sediment metagenome TaxID=412755 RepID=X1BG63_9ZZZZ
MKDSPEGLSLEEILRRYNAKEIVERRLLRLARNGQIRLKSNKYYIARPTMLWAARFLAALKYILLKRNVSLINLVMGLL